MKIKSLLNKFFSKGFYPYKLLIVIAVLGVLATLVAYFVSQAEAVTTRNLRSQVQSVRYRVTAADVAVATSPDVSGAMREVTLFTLAGGDQILSWVSNVSTVFTMPGGERVAVAFIQARQNGVPLSACDIAFPPELTFVNFEHRLGNCLEYAFYDEDLPTDIVVSFQSSIGTDLAGLTAGQVDFIVSRIQ